MGPRRGRATAGVTGLPMTSFGQFMKGRKKGGLAGNPMP